MQRRVVGPAISQALILDTCQILLKLERFLKELEHFCIMAASKEPKGAKGVYLTRVLKRGLGVANEELESIRDAFLDHGARLQHLEGFEDMVTHNVNALHQSIVNVDDDLQEAKVVIVSLHDRLSAIEGLLAQCTTEAPESVRPLP